MEEKGNLYKEEVFRRGSLKGGITLSLYQRQQRRQYNFGSSYYPPTCVVVTKLPKLAAPYMISEAYDRDKTLIVETVTHPGGNDWDVSSVTYSDTTNQRKIMLLFLARVYADLQNLPDEVFRNFVYRFNPRSPYMKTPRLVIDCFGSFAPTLTKLLEKVDQRDMDCYFQFYPGWEDLPRCQHLFTKTV